MKLINRTCNGQITFCTSNEVFHIEFSNVFLTLTPEELQHFYGYIYSIDYKYYLRHNEDTFNRRKLFLEVGSNKVMFGLCPNEFNELKDLLSVKRNTWYLTPDKVYFDNILIFN